ncbi:MULTISPECIES: teichoic acid D-Ala incorporation-associated protein DltX [Staphylococcus]|uniref:D-Ala-teichoic acid biosynthesis protein n=3 Tax=Staphylococcus TaxID=1279 RepID=A0AAC9RS91_9STAP|nr:MULTISPECIES: teichoic acid D-Ala incorporation-associated protein DltX [Staphylococcus]ELP8735601.1 teichoic acid D-Ala incorporation-associated protein DltX [Staphylococcus pseudintermedius]ARJ51463.1 D-Ala-teichoic acid biosynthesis protein [Staphylococcus lutrae]PCF65293.1 D-Ala-teichoic acid biosynthesis protein [Staphylococcus intermedius]PCF80971.1 D-Ala-teichoic acid biosynthesis protein [Staphylococcus intermedius]PCF82253.1 D-Ala-teichoic acid biosynthesis protein [Staphylococcus 
MKLNQLPIKTVALTLLYFAIMLTLYFIYGNGDTQNTFIYNDF